MSDHASKAEHLMERAKRIKAQAFRSMDDDKTADQLMAEAQVHASLAVYEAARPVTYEVRV